MLPASGPWSIRWHRTLKRPSWNPPDWIFGPVWTTLYILMAVAAWLVWRPVGFADERKALLIGIATGKPHQVAHAVAAKDLLLRDRQVQPNVRLSQAADAGQFAILGILCVNVRQK